MVAADGDPLRAQEIDENISEEWWMRWQEYNTATNRAQQMLANRRKHGVH